MTPPACTCLLLIQSHSVQEIIEFMFENEHVLDNYNIKRCTQRNMFIEFQTNTLHNETIIDFLNNNDFNVTGAHLWFRKDTSFGKIKYLVENSRIVSDFKITHAAPSFRNVDDYHMWLLENDHEEFIQIWN